MAKQLSVNPKVQLGRFVSFLKSKEFIVAVSAIVITPLVLKNIEAFSGKIPLIRDSPRIALIVMSIVILALGFMFDGIFRAIALGLAAGVFITAISPEIDRLISGVTK